jgi:hypothetical protein
MRRAWTAGQVTRAVHWTTRNRLTIDSRVPKIHLRLGGVASDARGGNTVAQIRLVLLVWGRGGIPETRENSRPAVECLVGC